MPPPLTIKARLIEIGTSDDGPGNPARLTIYLLSGQVIQDCQLAGGSNAISNELVALALSAHPAAYVVRIDHISAIGFEP